MKLNSVVHIIAVLTMMLNTSCQGQETGLVTNPSFDKKISSLLNFDVPIISVQDALAKRNIATFLDAREIEEYQVSHLPNAIYIGYDDFDIEDVSNIDKNKPVIVYCSIGYRSEKISKKLKAAGFSDVKNLYGSIFEWVNQGYEIMNRNDVATDSIHTYNRSWSKWMTNKKLVKVY